MHWDISLVRFIKFSATIKVHAFSTYTQGMNRINKNFHTQVPSEKVHKNTMSLLGWVDDTH